MSNYKTGRGKGNPWRRGRENLPREQSNQEETPKCGQTMSVNNLSHTSTSATSDKFLKAKQHMKEAADKHKLSSFESSSEEDELESQNILGMVLSVILKIFSVFYLI